MVFGSFWFIFGCLILALVSLRWLYRLYLLYSPQSMSLVLGRPASTVLAMLSAFPVALIYIAGRRYYFFGGTNRWYVVFYPLGVVVTLSHQFAALLRALGVGTLTWRGTRYRDGKVVSSA